MSDIFKQILGFAADPPEGGGGGTKATISGGQLVSEADPTDPTPSDPPENGGGGTGSTTDPSTSG